MAHLLNIIRCLNLITGVKYQNRETHSFKPCRCHKSPPFLASCVVNCQSLASPLWVKAGCVWDGKAPRSVCVCVCVVKRELECGYSQMVDKPTFQLGWKYKYPWLIGMWRLLAQKAQIGQAPRPRRSLTLSVMLEAAQGYFEIGHNNFKLSVFVVTTLYIPVSVFSVPSSASSIALQLKVAFS